MKPVQTKLAIGLMLLTVTGAIAAPTTAPSYDEIQRDFDAKQYADVVKKAALATQPRPDAPTGDDRARLLALKGEAHLRLKQSVPAADAFAAAAKVATDAKDAATYTATGVLVRKSVAGQYTPKPATGAAKPESISIIEPDSRKSALAALFADELKVATAKQKELEKQTTLPPLMTGVKEVTDLRQIELAATGSDLSTKQMVRTLTDKASELMGTLLDHMQADVQAIASRANRGSVGGVTIGSDGMEARNTNRRGVMPNEIDVLNEAKTNCQDILEVCDELQKAQPADDPVPARGRRFGRGAGNSLNAVRDSATQLSQRIDNILSGDFGGTRAGTRGRRGRANQQ